MDMNSHSYTARMSNNGLKYRAVLFDFDGTLTPSLPLWVNGYRIALGGAFGLDLSDDEIIERCFFRDWADVAADLGISSADELRVQVLVGVHEAFLEAQLFPARAAVARALPRARLADGARNFFTARDRRAGRCAARPARAVRLRDLRRRCKELQAAPGAGSDDARGAGTRSRRSDHGR